MIAVAWRWQGGSAGFDPDAKALARRLATSLCAGIGGSAAQASVAGAAFAYRPLRANPALARAWRPAVLESGRLLAFHGYIDNASSLAAELGANPRDTAQIYGRALDRWGDEADRRIVGEYATVVVDSTERRCRLSRSPLRAPPLHYHRSAQLLVAASVPRAVFAAGVPRHLNEERIADSLWLNFSDETASWYRDMARVPLGTVVTLDPHGSRLKRFYDILALPEVRYQTDADYLERAGELLDEGVRAAIAGAQKPGTTLSSGLDSPQVAARTLAALPPNQRLPSFTFLPEDGWDGVCPTGMHGDERSAVEAFAALHPRLDPHFTSNEGIGHDHRWNELFHLMGGAPSGMCNMYVFHGLWSSAAQQGCDLLLLGDWGNSTFSVRGEWAFAEYLRTGQWRQLWLALRRNPNDRRSMARRFAALALVPYLPPSIHRFLMRLWHPRDKPALELISPLKPSFVHSSGVADRARSADIRLGAYRPRNKHEGIRLLFANADAEAADIYQGFEQLYGVPQRDPMAYRPWVEFCLGLPTSMFLRDGEPRWFAKQLAKGLMPDEQRANRSNGRWDADWHLRIGRRREEWLRELDQHQADPRFARMLDTARVRRALEEFPSATSVDPQVWMPVELGLPRLLLTARFVNWVEGRNR